MCVFWNRCVDFFLSSSRAICNAYLYIYFVFRSIIRVEYMQHLYLLTGAYADQWCVCV